MRHFWLCCWFLCLGCHSLVNLDVDHIDLTPTPRIDKPDQTGTEAKKLWQLGQQAMIQGKPRTALDYYENSLKADISFARNHLSMAAAYLEDGNEASACTHLGRYLDQQPERAYLRKLYGELLIRQHRVAEACSQFNRYIADGQEGGDKTLRQRIQCHCRLMQLAEQGDDNYHAHLERGIGLYLLARRSQQLGVERGEASSKTLLWKAVDELAQAQSLKPDEARPCWYLHRVWSHLTNERNATHWLQQASKVAPYSYMTPAEHRSLELASRRNAPTL